MDSEQTGVPGTVEAERKLAHLQRVFVVFGSTLLILLGAVATGIVFAIPRFEVVFSEMLGDKPLPALTQLSIGLAGLGDGLLLLLLTAALPLATVIHLAIRPGNRSAWWTTLGVGIFLLLFIAVVSMSLALPMIAMLTELGAP